VDFRKLWPNGNYYVDFRSVFALQTNFNLATKASKGQTTNNWATDFGLIAFISAKYKRETNYFRYLDFKFLIYTAQECLMSF